MTYKKFLSWITTPIYILLFVLTLVIYHPILVIANWISYGTYSIALLSMCNSLLRNLSWIAGTRFTFLPHVKIPEGTPLLVISNHQSMYDIPMLVKALHSHDPRFISKKELGKWLPSISFTLRTTHSALIDRKDRRQSVQAIREAAALAMRDNAALCIFPEGTRARDGVMKKFKIAGVLSILEQVPDIQILPIAISRSWELFRYNHLPVPFGVHVSVSVMAPVDPRGKNQTQLMEALENSIKAEVERLDATTKASR